MNLDITDIWIVILKYDLSYWTVKDISYKKYKVKIGDLILKR
jgi:hypothetical protein